MVSADLYFNICCHDGYNFMLCWNYIQLWFRTSNLSFNNLKGKRSPTNVPGKVLFKKSSVLICFETVRTLKVELTVWHLSWWTLSLDACLYGISMKFVRLLSPVHLKWKYIPQQTCQWITLQRPETPMKWYKWCSSEKRATQAKKLISALQLKTYVCTGS